MQKEREMEILQSISQSSSSSLLGQDLQAPSLPQANFEQISLPGREQKATRRSNTVSVWGQGIKASGELRNSHFNITAHHSPHCQYIYAAISLIIF